MNSDVSYLSSPLLAVPLFLSLHLYLSTLDTCVMFPHFEKDPALSFFPILDLSGLLQIVASG